MKTEPEIQSVIDYLCTDDESDLCGHGDDLPYIENVRAFKEALRWVLQPGSLLTRNSADKESRAGLDGDYYLEYVEADIVHLRRCR